MQAQSSEIEDETLPALRFWAQMTSTPKRREEAAMALCECVIDLVAAYFDVSGRDLRMPGRSEMAVSRVRQIGMYLAHVEMQIPMRHVGRGFARDRTTVAHACKVIEDMREEPEFERILGTLERMLRAMFPREDG